MRITLPVSLAGAATALLLVVGAVPAAAHVTVSSTDARPGGFGKIVFRVPSEAPRLRTVSLTVTLPAATPFASVSTRSHPGWTVSTTERTLSAPVTDDDGFTIDRAVGTVTWRAQGAGLQPGEFDEFELSVGPFPARAGTVAFTAVQGYSDGSTVRWDEPQTAGRDEPEHPAPTLALAAAPAPGGTAGGPPGSDSSDATARTLGVLGLVAGLAALALALVAARRPRNSATISG